MTQIDVQTEVKQKQKMDTIAKVAELQAQVAKYQSEIVNLDNYLDEASRRRKQLQLGTNKLKYYSHSISVRMVGVVDKSGRLKVCSSKITMPFWTSPITIKLPIFSPPG